MSHHSEHQKMKRVLDLAHELDIATNPHTAAIFEAGSGGFQVWCTPQDHPKGWDGIVMNSGSFSKPCEYVGSVHWKWEDETIVALEIETSAYALAEQKPNEFSQEMNLALDDNRRTIFNRDADIEWLQEKITWLFEEAGVPLLPFQYEQAPLSQIGPYILAHYKSDSSDEYVVIVSPELDPQEFCKPGYELVHTLEIWRAGDFPADEILRPDRNFLESRIEPQGSPLLDQFQILTHMPQDSLLEAEFEDRISGWNE
jgi:hypothetical protein